MRSKQTIVLGLLVLFIACSGPGPQRPSQRKSDAPKADSAQLALMELNQQLTAAADETLHSIILQQEEAYAMYNNGTWGTVLKIGDTSKKALRFGEECTIHMRVLRLDGKLYCDTEQTSRIGMRDWPIAVDRNLSEWHHGAHIKLYAPWYSAYGIQGTKEVPPYENVIIELEIE